MSSRLPRYWAESNLPRPMSPLLPRERRLEAIHAVGRVLFESREDPDRLAVACAAWCRLGWPPGNWYLDIQGPPNDYVFHRGEHERWSEERALDAAWSALKHKRRRDLTQRADGLIQAILVLGEDATSWRRHELAVDGRMRECVALTQEERILLLRRDERVEEVERKTAEWHELPTQSTGPSALEYPSLHDYLGMTWEQYKAYVERGALPSDHAPRVSINADGRYVEVGFDDTESTMLRIVSSRDSDGDPSYRHVDRTRQWVAAVRRMIKRDRARHPAVLTRQDFVDERHLDPHSAAEVS